jgi:hypothetical protein
MVTAPEKRVLKNFKTLILFNVFFSNS